MSKAGVKGWHPPVAAWLHGYQRSWLSKDVVGGLAAGAVVIP
jgi:SulP family sulfate permease